MAKNLGREFATMTDEERRRFELERAGTESEPSVEEAADELALDDPRDEDRMGRPYGSLAEEVADPEHRDGAAAQLDDEAHRRSGDAQRRRGG
jgi:hypothetical protein